MRRINSPPNSEKPPQRLVQCCTSALRRFSLLAGGLIPSLEFIPDFGLLPYSQRHTANPSFIGLILTNCSSMMSFFYINHV